MEWKLKRVCKFHDVINDTSLNLVMVTIADGFLNTA